MRALSDTDIMDLCLQTLQWIAGPLPFPNVCTARGTFECEGRQQLAQLFLVPLTRCLHCAKGTVFRLVLTEHSIPLIILLVFSGGCYLRFTGTRVVQSLLF